MTNHGVKIEVGEVVGLHWDNVSVIGKIININYPIITLDHESLEILRSKDHFFLNVWSIASNSYTEIYTPDDLRMALL